MGKHVLVHTSYSGYDMHLASESGNAKGTKHSKGSELVVGGDWIDSDTEFLILASNGIWEVSPQNDIYSGFGTYIKKYLIELYLD